MGKINHGRTPADSPLLNRRIVLAGLPAATLAGATLPAAAEATAEARFAHHFAELQRATRDLDPSITDWEVHRVPDRHRLAMFIFAKRETGGAE